MILLKDNVNELEIVIKNYIKKTENTLKIVGKHPYSYLLKESIEIIQELQNKIEEYEYSINDAGMEQKFYD